MADDSPLVASIAKQTREGFDRLLLAPVFLIHEIIAIVVPGILFIVLLFFKGNSCVVSELHFDFLGYKTRLFIGLILCYVVGKMFAIPSDVASKIALRKFAKEVANPTSGRVNDLTKRFLVGIFVLPDLFGAENALTYMVLTFTAASFYMTTGSVLLVASVVPGDHFGRLAEATLGLLSFARGYLSLQSCVDMGISMLGISFSGSIQKLFPGKMTDVMQIGLALLNSKTEKPADASAVPTTGAPPVTASSSPVLPPTNADQKTSKTD
jgi:hypothetical protein